MRIFINKVRQSFTSMTSVLNFRLETGIALAALGLHSMFVLYLISLYFALSRPIEQEFHLIFYPIQLLVVGLFLFGITGFGLAGVAYILSKRDVPRNVSFILLAQGVILLGGMLYSSSIYDNINEEYQSFELSIVPILFLIASFAPIGLGIHLTKLKPMRRRYT